MPSNFSTFEWYTVRKEVKNKAQDLKQYFTRTAAILEQLTVPQQGETGYTCNRKAYILTFPARTLQALDHTVITPSQLFPL